jgi:hypothetical protein
MEIADAGYANIASRSAARFARSGFPAHIATDLQAPEVFIFGIRSVL